MMSARLPVSCPNSPTDLTLGDWSGLASPTSKLILLFLCPLRGARCESHGTSFMRRRVNVEKTLPRPSTENTRSLRIKGTC